MIDQSFECLSKLIEKYVQFNYICRSLETKLYPILRSLDAETNDLHRRMSHRRRSSQTTQQTASWHQSTFHRYQHLSNSGIYQLNTNDYIRVQCWCTLNYFCHLYYLSHATVFSPVKIHEEPHLKMHMHVHINV